MNASELAKTAQAVEWYRQVEEMSCEVVRLVNKVRDSRRDISCVPIGWYVTTELLIAMQSMAYALQELASATQPLL